MAELAWRVEPQGFVTEAGNFMRASCAHRSDMKACGGCYARFQVLIDTIEREPQRALELIRMVTFAMRAEVQEAHRG